MPPPDVDLAVHATAVAIDGGAALIFGPSRSGKSSLAATLMARDARVGLVGDDRVLLRQRFETTLVRPHPRIAGFLERRGLGLVALRHVAQAAVVGTIDLGDATIRPAMLHNLPALSLVAGGSREAWAGQVLAWWTSLFRGGEDTSGKKRC